MNRIAEVVINNSAKQVGKIFHYLIPESISDYTRVGQLVSIPFGKSNRKTVGFIVGMIESSSFKELKSIIEVLYADELFIKKELIELAFWMSREYMCNVSDCIRLMLPPAGGLKLSKGKIERNPLKDKIYEKTLPFTPNKFQKEAIERISEYIENEQPAEFLLHGVTGSGKTEVYLQLISRVIEKERQAVVLVPEISLTPQMIQRFVGRFGSQVAVMHSRLSEGERRDQWYRIKEGKVKVVVGARSAVFAPFDNLGIIIIDEEHEHTYKSEKTPKYHAREVAYKRSLLEKCVVVLGSATPSVETYYRAVKGELNLVELPKRANSSLLPSVEIVDMRKELEVGNKSIFSRSLYKAVKETLERGEQVILFLNRRGYSNFVLCRNCGYTARCRNCNISLTYHLQGDRLVCHYCSYERNNFKLCPSCGSEHIRHFGVGTQKVEEQVKRYFQTASVMRMDMDTTRKKNSHEKILNKFRDENANILIGTQMIAKGHDFPNVTLVGVISADLMLNMQDFRSTEKTFQLLTQVAGRAGRAQKSGRVIIQTYELDNFSIQTAKEQDYKEFYRQEIILREQLGYPPFCDIVSIIITGADLKKVKEKSKMMEDTLKKELNKYGAEVLNAVPAPVSRIKNRFRWRIIIKCRINEGLKSKISNIVETASVRFEKIGNIGVDVNPLSML